MHDRLIRSFVAARDAGDAPAAAAAWERLVVEHWDRMRVWIAAWRHPQNGQPLPPGEREDALQLALYTATRNMVRTFHGTTLPEFVAALRTCTRFAAHNQWRAWVRHERHAAGSLDDPLLEAEAARHEAGDELAQVDLAAALEDAIARIPNEKQRKVVALDRLGAPDGEIAAALGVSVDYVYKLRQRGREKLKEVLGDDRP